MNHEEGFYVQRCPGCDGTGRVGMDNSYTCSTCFGRKQVRSGFPSNSIKTVLIDIPLPLDDGIESPVNIPLGDPHGHFRRFEIPEIPIEAIDQFSEAARRLSESFDRLFENALIVSLSMPPSLIREEVERRATNSSRPAPNSCKSCAYYAHSRHILCAVNPTRELEENCKFHEPR